MFGLNQREKSYIHTKWLFVPPVRCVQPELLPNEHLTQLLPSEASAVGNANMHANIKHRKHCDVSNARILRKRARCQTCHPSCHSYRYRRCVYGLNILDSGFRRNTVITSWSNVWWIHTKIVEGGGRKLNVLRHLTLQKFYHHSTGSLVVWTTVQIILPALT